MRNLKIIVLGSNGFIGSHIASYFHNLGNTIIGCDLFDGEKKYNAFHKLDINNLSLNELFSNYQFDYCINAAGNGDVNLSVSNPEQDFNANTFFTFQILEALRLHNPNCKFLFISSAAVYGNPEKLPVSETDSTNPISPYGWHKLMSETVCKEYYELYNIQSAIVRPFSVYGPGLKKQIIWDVFCKSKNQNEPLELWGGGNEARDFIYIDDLISAIDIILKQPLLKADIYNIASGEMTFIKDISSLLLAKLNRDNKIVFNGLVHKGNPNQWKADVSKLCALGFVPNVNIESGITKLASWLKTQ